MDPASTWRTSLMGSDLQALRDLSRSHAREHIKTILVEDDWEKNDPGPMIAGPDAPPPAGATHIWPRDEKRIVQHIGTADLQEMLRSRTLQPDTIIVRDFHGGNAEPSPAPPAQLAKEILDGSDAAITSIFFRRDRDCFSAYEVVAQLSPDHHTVGTSMLQEADLHLAKELDAYWPDLVFHAPNLSALKLFSIRNGHRAFPIPDTAVLNITSLELSCTVFSEDQLLSLLKRLRTSLTSLSLTMVSLPKASSWRSLLSYVATDCTLLTYFRLKLLKADTPGAGSVKFEMSKDEIPEVDRDGLVLTVKGLTIKPVPQPRVNAVQYSGANVASVLHVVAQSVVSWGYTGNGDDHEVFIARD